MFIPYNALAFKLGRGLEGLGCEEDGCEELMFLPNAVIMGCDAIRANLDSLADALGLAPGDNDCGALHFSGDLAVRSAAKVWSERSTV